MASIVPNTTTLLRSVGSSDTFIPLSSLTNINKGDVIFMDLEAMPVARLVPGAALPGVIVTRTGRAASHGIGATVYTGNPAVFATNDPVGVPGPGSQPYWINTLTGRVWVAQGDEGGPGAANRFWQLQTSTPGIGPLGVRTTAVSPV